MIRFLELTGKDEFEFEEELEFSFAFYCTITRMILTFNGRNNWNSMECFLFDFEESKGEDPYSNTPSKRFTDFIENKLEYYKKNGLLIKNDQYSVVIKKNNERNKI